MSINEIIFKTITEKGLKQSDLAKKLNITTGQVTAWKKRGTTPPAEYLIDICKFLQISIYKLLGEEEKELTSDEKQLLDNYRKCNEGNKQFILNAVAGLSNQDNKEPQELETKSSDLKIG